MLGADAGVADRDDVGVAAAGERDRLTHEAGPLGIVLERSLGHALDGEDLVQHVVAGGEDHAHAAARDGAEGVVAEVDDVAGLNFLVVWDHQSLPASMPECGVAGPTTCSCPRGQEMARTRGCVAAAGW